jgi:hypothetical protein
VNMTVDVFLYGQLAGYIPTAGHCGYANASVHVGEHCTVRDLLVELGIPPEKRGVTFINGKLSAMAGMRPDMEHVLADGDRVAFFDLNSMWPFQYRYGAPMVDEMRMAMSSGDIGLHHSYQQLPGTDSLPPD